MAGNEDVSLRLMSAALDLCAVYHVTPKRIIIDIQEDAEHSICLPLSGRFQFVDARRTPAAPAPQPEEASEHGPGLDRAALDILAALRSAGRPLTRIMLLEALQKAGSRSSNAAVDAALQAMEADGTVEHLKEGRPRGYRLTDGEEEKPSQGGSAK
ncbi:MAG TPA: helix-turn-helix domain-containing protein [Gemmataceae bacterium]|nr:helix-turn-helix domain-containing protein [Gemmataceae bacterium]